MDDLTIKLISGGIVGAAGLATYLIGKNLNSEKRFYTKAGIEDVMMPLVLNYKPQNSNIYILESANNIQINPATIKTLLDNQNKINCLLIGSSTNTSNHLEDIQKANNGRFQLDTINNNDKSIKSDRVKELIKKYEHFHFILFDNPKQMWIEGYHSPNENTSNDCEYVPPRDASSDPRFNRFLSNFLLLQRASRI